MSISSIPTVQPTAKATSVTLDQNSWRSWITNQTVRLDQAYTAQPDRVISDYYREESCVKDYHGRELLELLQNADDAGVDYEGQCRAKVLLTHAGLCIANTGRPFTTDGVKSLIISDNSPKKTSRASYIGNKGLGFRSILGWSLCPFILSGELRLGFDTHRATLWLDDLCSRSDEVRERIARETARVGPKPFIAKLSLPAILEHDGTVSGSQPSADGFSELWEMAGSLRRDGYETVVGIPFWNDETFKEAQAQLEVLRREFLLFTNHLESLAITQEGKSRTWTVERDANVVEIKSDAEPTEIWEVFGTEGDIPFECLSDEIEQSRGFQVKIAVPVNGGSAPGYLYSFFPTRARFPYPVVAHVTFELTANRQSVNDTPANRFLTSKLAEEMARAAEASVGGDPWRPLSIVTASTACDPTLEDMGLPTALTLAVAERKVIPVRRNELVRPRDAKRLLGHTGEWLPLQGFDDFVLSTEHRELSEAIRSLGVPAISDLALGERLKEQSTSLTIEQRASLIVGLVEAGLMPTNPVPPLLIDEQEAVIPAEFRVFLPPTEDTSLSLPEWMSLRILNYKLANHIRRRTDTDSRELRTLLSDYRVTPYSVTNLAEALVAQANERVRNTPESSVSSRREMVRALFELFNGSSEGHKALDVPVEVVNAAGTLADAQTLYLSSEYEGGLITAALYGPLGKGRLIAAPSELGLATVIPADAEKFLLWLGVASQPRVVRMHASYNAGPEERLNPAFIEFAKSSFKPPIRTDREELNAADLSVARFTGVESVDSLDELLRRAPPEVIVAWIATDERLNAWRRGDGGASVTVKLAGQHVDRTIRAAPPSYILWKLAHTPWLPSTTGERKPPSGCMLAQTIPDELQSLLPRPAIGVDSELFVGLGIDAIAVKTALERVGVKGTFEDFPLDELYRLLLELPSLDPDGGTAKSLYRAIISRPDTETNLASVTKSRFMTQGKLRGRLGRDLGYYSVRQLYYLGKATVPAVVQERVPLLDLDKSQGVQKVKRVFGVNQLEPESWSIVITRADAHPNARQVSDHVQSLKPFVYAFRFPSDSAATGLARLKALSVCLAAEVEGTATLKETAYPLWLQAKGDVVNEGDTYYLAAGDAQHDALADAVLMTALGEIFAEALGPEWGSEFAMLCMAPPGQRKPLLARLLGVTDDEADMRLSQVSAKLEWTMLDESTGSAFSPWAPAPPAGTDPATKPGTGQEQGGPDDVGTKPAARAPVHSVIVETQEHTPSPPPRTIAFRIQATPASLGVPPAAARITDARRCQDVIEHVENQLGRFALPVSQLQGREAYGCDFLSFGSAEVREEFRSQQVNPNVNLVERFIEVKGKSRDSSTIELRGNELAAARSFGARYYLYRVYEGKPGEFDIITLANPVVADRNDVIEITLARQSKTNTKRYHAQAVTADGETIAGETLGQMPASEVQPGNEDREEGKPNGVS